MFILPIVLASILAATPAMAEIVGLARVVDGDTLVVVGVRVRLAGIDAPEQRQQCWRPQGVWSCGRIAQAVLDAMVDGRTVTCAEAGRDRYRRVVAVCAVDGVELNSAMVAEGRALAYRSISRAYVADEDKAREAGRGVWGSTFLPPWTWRRR
jgi:endonuclease YncB( thermonuclease family)